MYMGVAVSLVFVRVCGMALFTKLLASGESFSGAFLPWLGDEYSSSSCFQFQTRQQRA